MKLCIQASILFNQLRIFEEVQGKRSQGN